MALWYESVYGFETIFLGDIGVTEKNLRAFSCYKYTTVALLNIKPKLKQQQQNII